MFRLRGGDILRVAKKSNEIGDYFFPPAPFPALCVVKWDLCAWMWEVKGKETYYIHFPDAWATMSVRLSATYMTTRSFRRKMHDAPLCAKNGGKINERL